MENILLGISSHEVAGPVVPISFIVSPFDNPQSLSRMSDEIPRYREQVLILAKEFLRHPIHETPISPDGYLRTMVFLSSIGRLRSSILQGRAQCNGYYHSLLDCYVAGDLNDFIWDTKNNYLHITAMSEALPLLILKDDKSTSHLCKAVTIKATKLIGENF